MAHELDTNADGETRFAFNKRNGNPWHGLGQPADGLMTVVEGLKAAHLDWEVELQPMYQKLASGKTIPVKDAFLVVRDEDEAVLGKVTKRYVPIQNLQAFNFAQAILDSDEAQLDTCGALRGGKQVFVSMTLPEGSKILGEQFRKYLLLSTSHTGLSALTARIVMTKVVCANTEQMAFGEAVPVFSFPHVTGIEEQVAQAREAIGFVSAYEAEFQKIVEKLADTRLVLTQVDALLRDVLPDRLASDDNVDAIRRNVASSPTIADENRRNMWGLYSGFTEWAEHLRPVRTQEGRFHSVIDGDVARTRDRLVRKVLVKA